MKSRKRLIRMWRLSIPFFFIWLELVFHLYMRLDMIYAPVFLLFAFAAGMLCTGVLFLLPERAARITGAVLVTGLSLLFTVECICKDILQQYYQIFSAAETAAGNHLTDYAPAVAQSLVKNIPGILLMFVLPVGLFAAGLVFMGPVKGRKKKQNSTTGTKEDEKVVQEQPVQGKRVRKRWWTVRRQTAFVRGGAFLVFGALIYVLALGTVFILPWKGDFTPGRLYQSDTNADDQVEQLGLITMLRLDVKHSLFGAPQNSLPEIRDGASMTASGDDSSSGEGTGADGNADGTDNGENSEGGGQTQEKEYPYNEMNIDFEAMKASAPNDSSKWLDEYFASTVPTRQNEYTGMFEGYNVIFITAEGFSGYMIDPELTPTLYKLSHEGFVFNNFYSALHFTSTSGGEFQNLTGLYPKAGFPVSMTETGKQSTYLPFTLANQLNKKGYTSIGYHFNQNMYGRELSHPNLGYDWRQFTKCDRPLTPETNQNGDAHWPQSDDYMVEQTFDEYAAQQPFNVYYLTISGHLPYGFSDSMMSYFNKDAVSDLPYSEKTKAYIAANLELEKGLTRLVDYLEKAGIADKTVIALAPDHIPYSDIDVLEELAGRSFNSSSLENLDEENVDLDVYKNTWILWSGSMEEPVVVDKPCSQVDILPTLSNLLGLEYDSRMLAGTDVLSDSDPVVIFYSGSWLTDQGKYNRYTGEFTPAEGVEMTEEEKNVYVENVKYIVNSRLRLGQLIIENDYYRQALE